MKTIRRLVIAILSCTALAGCISPKSFVDPAAPKVAYEDLHKRPEPLKLVLSVEFQRNGKPLPKADSTLRDNAERVLRASGIITPVAAADAAASAGTIQVTVNNIADVGGAAAKGFGTGLTFGLVGSTVMDAYELSMTITANGKTVTRSAIKDSFYTAIGNATLPPNVELVPPNVAFGRVLERMLLKALIDMQKTGELAGLPALYLPGAEPARVALSR